MRDVSLLLEVAGLSLQRGNGRTFTLPTLHLEAREAVALFGPSGCGKSTILKALFGLGATSSDRRSGSVRWRGEDLFAVGAARLREVLRLQVAVLAQDAANALDPMQRVGDQLRAVSQRSPTDCADALVALGINRAADLPERYPHQISGGQAQRVVFAVAALRDSALVIADEPTANLDGAACAAVCAQLSALRARGAALLVATHDPRLLLALSPRVLVAKEGAFVPGEAEVGAFAPCPRDLDGSAPVVLRASGLGVRLGGRVVLDGIDLNVRRGEVVAVLGESGVGKTTLARALAGRMALTSGVVERPEGCHSVQLMSQDAAQSLTPGRTLASLLAEATASGFDIAANARWLGLDAALLDRTAAQMSSGERQRAALLRAVAVRPAVLILDEPTASLDRTAGRALLHLLSALRERAGTSILRVTHDTELAAASSHRVLHLSRGQLWQE